ncbi:hypothetical protein [Bradyrhizobium sp. AUGA SZCCT0124]|uniref:hypothetical protein n=2 Tax=Bradyrhizobium TaxID=374 RepID=UPI0039080CAA
MLSSEACPGLDPGWAPVRAKKTRQNEAFQLPFRATSIKNATIASFWGLLGPQLLDGDPAQLIQYGYISGVAMVFEAIVSGVILLALGYWATMFVMGRRDDVLHGKFVEDEPAAEPVRFMPRMQPAPQPNKDSLQALLTVIKRDLNDAARS